MKSRLLKSNNTDGRQCGHYMWRTVFHGCSLFMYENLIAQKVRIQTKQLLQLCFLQTTDRISLHEYNFLCLTMKCVPVKCLRDHGQGNWVWHHFSSYAVHLIRWIITTGWNRLTKSAVRGEWTWNSLSFSLTTKSWPCKWIETSCLKHTVGGKAHHPSVASPRVLAEQNTFFSC